MKRTALLTILAGGLLALSLPPWGWWPLAIGGIAVLDRLIADQPFRTRFRRGWLVTAVLFFPTLTWLISFTLPGWVIAAGYFAFVFGLACAVCPPSAPARWIALPGAWVLAEAWRGRWPFGGVPVSRLALGQVGGPLVGVVRVGGPLLLDLVTVALGVALAVLLARRYAAVAVPFAAVVLLVAGASIAPSGHDVAADPIRLAVVQGGGAQGTRADDTDPGVVFDRHLQASDLIKRPVDLVLWPEDIVDVEGPVTNTPEGDELRALAQRLHATVLAGVVEGDGDGFHNAVVAISPEGEFIDRYEKVRRVPFGEYVPFRWLLKPIAGDSLITRDAVASSDAPVLHTPVGPLGVSTSWEIFFADRARAAVRDGGQVLLNPTNGASFRGSLIQNQQVAATRLRAIETGRWAVQAAPTGFSVIVTPSGRVVQRAGITEQRVLEGEIRRREGETIAVRVGDWLALLAALALVGGGWFVERRSRSRLQQPSNLQHDGDGAVVDEGDLHVGPEATGGHGGAEVAQPVGDGVDEGRSLLGSGGVDPRRASPP